MMNRLTGGILLLMLALSVVVADTATNAVLLEEKSIQITRADVERELETLRNPIIKAAFALTEAGQTSEVLESSRGLHILHLLENEAAGYQPFAEVKEQLMQKVMRDHDNQVNTKIIQSFYPSPDTKVDPEQLRDVVQAQLRKITLEKQ